MIETNWLEDGDDLADTHLIRRKVFIEEQNVDESIELDDSDIGAVHLVVYDNKVPVATGRLIEKDGKRLIGRVAVLKEHRKNGYGDLVVRMLIRRAFDEGFNRQYAHSQCSVQGFYEKLGFVAYGDVYQEASIDHISMYHEGDVTGCSG